jgi:Na+-transporting NADH:ubiquinone oxidoreductase subunit NqrD
MNRQVHRHVFWRSTSPLACLSGVALLIIASDRLAHAIIATIALIWVYCLSLLAVRISVRFFPRRGRMPLLAFLCSFIAGVFLLMLWILSPLCALESFFVISLVPMHCIASGVFKRLETINLDDAILDSFSESLLLGLLIVIFALIREPIGFLSLSLPGGTQGIILLFTFKSDFFLPVSLVSGSSGALLLLGYLLGLYRYLRAKYAPQEDNDDH